MRVMKFISVAVGVAMLLTLASAQQAATAPSTPTVKHVPSMRAPVNSGKDMFNRYCAVCHGTDAKGPAQRLRR
jgi:mono/diheme cytochrome c family protein